MTKQDLASLYFPGVTAGTAMRNLNQWIRRSPQLSKALHRTSYYKGKPQLNSYQLNLILHHLGKPLGLERKVGRLRVTDTSTPQPTLTKGELARRYFPDTRQNPARIRLMQWVIRCRQLSVGLVGTPFLTNTSNITPHDLNLIYRYLDPPEDEEE